MKRSRRAVGALAVLVASLSGAHLGSGALHGQTFGLDRLQPNFRTDGDIVAPYFDGWYENPDGTFTYSFGYMNRNTEEVVDIPLGPNNFISPEQFDGVQPTHFVPVRYQGYSGRRERGVFSVTVPAGFDGDVVWTLTHAGRTYAIPARATSTTYELGHFPMGSGSLPPTIRLGDEGPEGRGRAGLLAAPMSASVGVPLQLLVSGEDQGIREERYPVNMTWQKHQGPGSVVFGPVSGRIAAGEQGTTTATFSEPGEYVLRVRIDNFLARDSNFGFQCCWSNGYVAVSVK
jgi:hypothetical protein